MGMNNVELTSEEKDTIVEVIAIPSTKSQKKAFYETAERLKRFRERTRNEKLKKLTQLSREKLDELLVSVNAYLDEAEEDLDLGRQAG
jgi:hypothetical protein